MDSLPLALQPQSGLGVPPWNSPFHFSLLDLRQSAGLLRQVISSLQGLMDSLAAFCLVYIPAKLTRIIRPVPILAGTKFARNFSFPCSSQRFDPERIYWDDIVQGVYKVVLQIWNLITLDPHMMEGHAIAQAVSCWLPTAAVRVRSQVCSNGICGEQSSAGVGFLRVLWFPLPIFIPPNSPSSQSPEADNNRPVVADVPSGPNMNTWWNKLQMTYGTRINCWCKKLQISRLKHNSHLSWYICRSYIWTRWHVFPVAD
jgi:hypothetical protein